MLVHTAFLLQLLSLSFATSSINDSYYRGSNLTSLRHYAYGIVNGSRPLHTDLHISADWQTSERPISSTDDTAKYLSRSSVIFGISNLANQSNVTPLCHAQLKHIQRSILSKQSWAIKVLDASGTRPAGFLFGHNYWLGSREVCTGVQQRVGVTLSKNYERVMNQGIITDTAPFEMDYRVVYLRHNSPWQVEIKLMSEQIIHIGLCLPRACSSLEVQQLTGEYMESGLLADSQVFEMRTQAIYVKDLQLRCSFYQRRAFKLVVFAVIATCALMLGAQQLRERESMPAKRLSEDATNGLAPAESELWRALDAILADEQRFRRLKDFVRCFDVQRNCAKIFAMRDCAAHEIPIMNGLRSICAGWIMIFHIVWYMYFTVHNKTSLLSYGEQLLYQYVSTGPLIVDVFFTISGFLQTHNFLRNAQQMQAIRSNNAFENIKLFGKLLFHRYLRLAPLYLIVMGVVDVLFSYIGDVSLYHIHERFDILCSKYWWRNLLFIQNFFGHEEMCMNWSWSLACDMQYFVLATIILFLYAKEPKLGKTLALITLIASLTWSYGIAIITKFQFSFDAAYATGSHIYISSFVRVFPYILGALTAWCLAEGRGRLQFDFSERRKRRYWLISVLLFFICIHSTIKRDLNHWFATTLFVLGRGFFSLSVCWMIVGSIKGSSVWWSRLLEAKVFQHVNRLSYAIYLLNPFIIALFFSLTSASTHADPYMLCVVTCGFAVIVYLMSIIFSLIFELPYSNFSSVLLSRSSKLKNT